MVNLIPPTAKRGVIIEYWVRVVTVWAGLASIAAILIAVVMSPVYVLVDSQITAYIQSADIASQKIASFKSVSEELVLATQQAQLVISSSKEMQLSEIIYLFNSLEGEGIALDSVSVNRIPTGIEPVRISGNAVDRQSLADFRDRLLAEERVETVDFPISNLAKDRDITFTITVTLSNQSAT